MVLYKYIFFLGISTKGLIWVANSLLQPRRTYFNYLYSKTPPTTEKFVSLRTDILKITK